MKVAKFVKSVKLSGLMVEEEFKSEENFAKSPLGISGIMLSMSEVKLANLSIGLITAGLHVAEVNVAKP